MPHPKLRPENITVIHSAMAGIEACLYEQAHGRSHPTAILLRHFETSPELTRLVFEKFDAEIMCLNSKGLLSSLKTQRMLVAKMTRAIETERGSS